MKASWNKLQVCQTMKTVRNISAKSRKKKVISTKKSADIPIRIFLNMVDLHLDSLDI